LGLSDLWIQTKNEMRLNIVFAFVLAMVIALAPLSEVFGQNRGADRDGGFYPDIERAILDKEVDPETYFVGPGDVFYFSIGSVERVEFYTEITPTGDLPLSKLGVVNVSGLTLAEVKERVDIHVSSQLQGAQVYTSLFGVKQIKVFLYGAVPEPGQYDILATNRLQDLISRTSYRQLAVLDGITITRLDGTVLDADLLAYRFDGDLDKNPVLRAGDVIYIPFTEFSEGIVRISGDVNYPGYRLLRANETYGELFRRTVEVKHTSDLSSVVLIRKDESGIPTITNYTLNSISDITPLPGDEIQILTQKVVNVHGHVGNPGSFGFIPGYTSGEYVTLAGGLLPLGTMQRLKVTREDGTILFGESIVIQRGDTIEVPKSLRGYIIGEVSILELLTSTASIVLAAYAILTR
jgi:protein involved in polysaccharide export with SLBB domain